MQNHIVSSKIFDPLFWALFRPLTINQLSIKYLPSRFVARKVLTKNSRDVIYTKLPIIKIGIKKEEEQMTQIFLYSHESELSPCCRRGSRSSPSDIGG
jgi:hypothetical protein